MRIKKFALKKRNLLNKFNDMNPERPVENNISSGLFQFQDICTGLFLNDMKIQPAQSEINGSRLAFRIS